MMDEHCNYDVFLEIARDYVKFQENHSAQHIFNDTTDKCRQLMISIQLIINSICVYLSSCIFFLGVCNGDLYLVQWTFKNYLLLFVQVIA